MEVSGKGCLIGIAIAFAGTIAVGGLIPDAPKTGSTESTTDPKAIVEAAEVSTPGFEFYKLGGLSRYTMVFARSRTPQEIEAAALRWCGRADFCRVNGWTDRRLAPTRDTGRLEMTINQTIALAYGLTVNRSSGFQQSLFKCSRYPTVAHQKCMVEPTRQELKDAE